MARSSPPSSRPVLVTLRDIVELEEQEGPRAAYAALVARMDTLRRQGQEVPQPFTQLERRLFSECCAESQGR